MIVAGARARFAGTPGRRALGVVLFAGAALVSTCLVRSFDTPWLLAAGSAVLDSGRLLARDPFSYTAARPWMHHEWLAEIAWASLYRAGGWRGVGLASGLLVVAPVALLLRARSLPLPRGAHGLHLAGAALLALGLREVGEPVAQALSTVLFALLLRLLVEEEAERPGAAPRANLVIAVVLLQLLWTQLHGGNPTGVALLATWLLAAGSRRAAALRLGLVGAAALLTCAGPYGARVHEHFFAHRATFAAVREFQPLAAALRAGSGLHVAFVLFVLAAGAALGARARAGERVRFEAVALLAFSVATILHARLATETALIAAQALLPSLARVAMRPWPALGLALALFGAGAIVSPRRLGAGVDPSRFPVAAVDFLQRARPVGPMFNSYNLGGYLLFAGPLPVFIDGRAFTVYSDEQVRELVALYDDPARFDALERRVGFRLAVLQRRGRSAGLRAFLARSGRWQIAYEDAVATVLVRAPAPGGI